MIVTHIELSKVFVRFDQPLRAIEQFNTGLKTHPFEVHFFTGIARVHEGLNDLANANTQSKKVLFFDNSNMEAIANLASYHFYSD